MARTKLDEIVEEEWFSRTKDHYNAWPECRAAAKMIAERAFRHGVEQKTEKLPHFGHCREQSYMYADGNCTCPRGRDVQPAPAGEKDDGESRHQTCACGVKFAVHPLWCNAPYQFDRRKGERRKGYEETAILRDGKRHWHHLMQSICAFPLDRRSGKDRRQK